MKCLFALSLYLITVSTAGAQNLAGSWNGELPTGMGAGSNLHIMFNIKQQGDTYTTTFDVLEQKALGIPCSTVLSGDSITININAIKATYKGKIAGNSINGKYSQNMVVFPVTLTRQLRPQTPKPPFNYLSEDVEYDNADKSIHFGATFTRPKGSGKYPVTIIISGSGTQDRDGTLFGHKLYAVLADHLTRNGVAVLRVDDRGAGKTSKGPSSATSASYADDVEAGLNYLKTRSDIDPKHLGLIGHSEGGIIAPMVAARRKDVNFVVLWGAPAVGGAAINVEQNADQVRQALRLDKVPGGSDDVEAFKQLHKKELEQFATSATVEELNAKIIPIFNTWKAAQKPETIQRLMVTDNGIVGQNIIAMYDGIYKIPWFKFFVTHDPTTDLRKVTCPVLAINGAKDTQVKPVENLALIQQTLSKAGNKRVKIVELPGLNHLLQTAKTGELAEYAQIEETLSPVALELISSWIKTQVK